MDVMDYTKCMHCNRIEKIADSTSNDTKLYTDCWYCDEAGSFIGTDSATKKDFNNNYVYGLFSFFIGAALLYCNKYTDLYSSGWWLLTIKGSGLIALCIIVIYAELSKVE